jgi:glycosyltransferase involved in cell wall biosynthesis
MTDSTGALHPMRLLFLNRFPWHGGYVRHLVGAARSLGHEAVLLGPVPQRAAAERNGAGFVEIDVATYDDDSSVLRAPSTIIKGHLDRRRVWRLDERFREDEFDVLVDLHAQRTLWAIDAGLEAPAVRVVHRSGGFDPSFQRTRQGRLASHARRRRIRHLGARGHRFVVHTEQAEQTLGELLPDGGVQRLYLPGPSPAPPPAEARWHPRPRLLFVGSPRIEKRFDLLKRALARMDVPTELVVTPSGHQGFPQPPTKGLSTITWLDEPLPGDGLRDIYHSCDLVVCAYGGRHARDGSASLVVGEALAYGRPLVVTTPMMSLLPPSYGGAVVVAPDDLDALRAGIEEAIGRLDVLEATASVEGPRFAAEHASPEVYLRELLRASTALRTAD